MFEKNYPRNAVLSFAFALITLISVQPVSAKTLEGQINIDEHMQQSKGASLTRSKKTVGDPFNNGGAAPSAEMFDAPTGAFDSPNEMIPPPPPQPFRLNVQDQSGDFGGQQGFPSKGNVFTPSPPANTIPQGMLPAMNRQDPEMSEQMQLQWDLWHRRVAEAIFVKFDSVAQTQFAVSRPLACEASYTVTANGQIKDIRLLRKSDDMKYNMMLMMVLQQMNGNPILQFPPGTHRQFVCKTGTFSRNCGVNGFKHTTNDRETISQRRPMY
jgi:hypothetical protein